MTTLYLDASVLVKRYCPEAGSAWVAAMTDPIRGHSIMTAEFALAEVTAAFAAKCRAPGGISLRERDNARSDFLSDCDSRYQLIVVNRRVVNRAVDLTQNHRLRGYDAIHLAAALTAHDLLLVARLPGLVFVAADGDLLAAARAEGLAAENPNDHP